jgi:hypothetical protein
LDEEPKKPKLMDIFKLYGPWEDTRNIEAIVSDIMDTRISKDNIIL